MIELNKWMNERNDRTYKRGADQVLFLLCITFIFISLSYFPCTKCLLRFAFMYPSSPSPASETETPTGFYLTVALFCSYTACMLWLRRSLNRREMHCLEAFALLSDWIRLILPQMAFYLAAIYPPIWVRFGIVWDNYLFTHSVIPELQKWRQFNEMLSCICDISSIPGPPSRQHHSRFVCILSKNRRNIEVKYCSNLRLFIILHCERKWVLKSLRFPFHSANEIKISRKQKAPPRRGDRITKQKVYTDHNNKASPILSSAPLIDRAMVN